MNIAELQEQFKKDLLELQVARLKEQDILDLVAEHPRPEGATADKIRDAWIACYSDVDTGDLVEDFFQGLTSLNSLPNLPMLSDDPDILWAAFLEDMGEPPSEFGDEKESGPRFP